MSKKKSSKSSFDAHPQDSTGSVDDTYSPIEGSLPEGQVAPIPPAPIPLDLVSEANDWEAVDLPGTVKIAATGPEVITVNSAKSEPACDQDGFTAKRENELLSLIHDLNECNDALLARISQTESALESAQSALQVEVERAKAAQAKMIEQMSAEQASVQQISQTAQQQIAKLVSKLDTTEQALQRQQLINETLQAELSDHQERVTQLEKESALISQQHAEAAQARIQAETVSRDLRSRLQRQQRYTLQFKAALEKSLTVKARPVYTASVAEAQLASYPNAPSVTMPKAHRIMPWVAAGSSAFTGIDPHLETLIRNASAPASEPVLLNELPAVKSAAADPASSTAAIDPEAEARLWQDLERVMNEVDKTPAPDTASLPAVPTEGRDAAATSPTPKSTKLNWQAAAQLARATETKVDAQPEIKLEKPSTAIEQRPVEAIAVKVEESFAAATGQPSAEEIGFTEPSPWGKPLTETKGKETAEPAVKTPVNQPANYSPLTDDPANSAVSPLVNPAQPVKRVSSMAAVQLPTFQKAKTGSFKR